MSFLTEATTLGDLGTAHSHQERDSVAVPAQKIAYAELANRADNQARSLISLEVALAEPVGMKGKLCSVDITPDTVGRPAEGIEVTRK